MAVTAVALGLEGVAGGAMGGLDPGNDWGCCWLGAIDGGWRGCRGWEGGGWLASDVVITALLGMAPLVPVESAENKVEICKLCAVFID